jgi:hypothetical protein
MAHATVLHGRTQVWTGSRDKTILAHDASTCITLFSLGDQVTRPLLAMSSSQVLMHVDV